MNRRTLLATVAGVAIAGCISTDSDETETDDSRNDSATDDEDSADESADDDVSETELVDQFQSTLVDRGFESVDIEHVDDRLELGYDATGTGEDDVAAELERIADGYVTTIKQGLSVTQLEAIAYDPDTGAVLDQFTIETEWVDAYVSESIEWRELLTRIAETFESAEPADEDGEDDADAEADDEAGGDADAEADEDEGGEDDAEAEGDADNET